MTVDGPVGSAPLTLRCQGCGMPVPPGAAAPWRCPKAGRDLGEHVVGRELAAAGLVFPFEGPTNPFKRYRRLTFAHSLWLSRGRADGDFLALVRELDEAVARVGGTGFSPTPLSRGAALSEALGFAEAGGVWFKDETGNVSGSHKGRHLMGLAILGEVRLRLGLLQEPLRLAIASCGNAALAAAVVAHAWRKPLDVFIPTDANPRVVAELERLQATVHVCPRDEQVRGDPCYRAFRAAVDEGALPFCCQGPDNGLTIEGGETLAWELVEELVRERRKLDRLFVQVGGGALASACVQGFRDAAALGVPVELPRLHPVQTRGAFPLRRAWEKLAARALARLRIGPPSTDAATAALLRTHAASSEVQAELAWAAARRSDYMWPWETPPHSVAHGILDDETYDWLAIVRGTLESGGWPVVVSEERLLEANALGKAKTGVPVDPTGSSGLAGLLELRATGDVGAGEAVGVIFSGVER